MPSMEQYLSLVEREFDPESSMGVLKFGLSLMKEQRAQQEAQFAADARVVQMMISNYNDSKSLAMKQHIADSMRAYWNQIDPRLQPAMEPFLKGSPLDEEVEKMQFFLRNNPPPKRPMKMPDEDPEDYKQKMAEYFYGAYLWQRQRQEYMGTKPGPLEKSFPLGQDENGDMMYVLKRENEPAQILGAKALQIAKLEAEDKVLPGTYARGKKFGPAEVMEHGGEKYVIRQVTDLVSGETSIDLVERMSLAPERKQLQYVPRPEGMKTAKAAIVTKFDPDEIPRIGKPDVGYQYYEDIYAKAEKISGAKDLPDEEKLARIHYELERLWPGWVFKLDPGGPLSENEPFGPKPSLKEAPGRVYSVEDLTGYKKKGAYFDLVYDEHNDVVYRSDLSPFGKRAFTEFTFGSPMYPYEEAPWRKEK